MKIAVLAALAATFFLPVAAQNATPTVEERTPPVATPAPAKAGEKSRTPRETARIAKSQNKDMKCSTKQNQTRQKKETAT